jgi:hypothetical protein
METDGQAVLDWSVAVEPLAGEAECGDDALVARLPDGALVAVVDGLGHGPAAAEAARRAIELLGNHANEALPSLVKRCHEALRTTRGVAMSAARFSVRDDAMTWVGVGTVEGRLVRQPTAHAPNEELIVFAGAAGVHMQRVYAATVNVQPGDTLVFATDGVDPRFADALRVEPSAANTAKSILQRHGKPDDDALVLVARYLGNTP